MFQITVSSVQFEEMQSLSVQFRFGSYRIINAIYFPYGATDEIFITANNYTVLIMLSYIFI